MQKFWKTNNKGSRGSFFMHHPLDILVPKFRKFNSFQNDWNPSIQNPCGASDNQNFFRKLFILPDMLDARSSSAPPSDRWRVKGGGAIPSRDWGRIEEGYPQGLSPESLLSSDFCRDIEPRPRPLWPRPLPLGAGVNPGGGPCGAVGRLLSDLPDKVGVPANDIAFEKRLDIVEVAGLNGWFWGVDMLLPSPPPSNLNLSLRLVYSQWYI